MQSYNIGQLRCLLSDIKYITLEAKRIYRLIFLLSRIEGNIRRYMDTEHIEEKCYVGAINSDLLQPEDRVLCDDEGDIPP